MAKGLSKTVGCSPNDRFTFACKRCVLSLEHVWKWKVPQENKTTIIKQHFCIIGATRLSSEHKSEVAYARLLNIVISYKRLGNNFIFSVIFLLVLFKANKFKESLSGLKSTREGFKRMNFTRPKHKSFWDVVSAVTPLGHFKDLNI